LFKIGLYYKDLVVNYFKEINKLNTVT